PEELGTVSDTSPRFCGPPIVKSLVGSVAGVDSNELRVGGVYDLVIPELIGVAGFDRAWALSATNSLRWSAARVGGTLGLGIEPGVDQLQHPTLRDRR